MGKEDESRGCCDTFKVNLARLIYEFIGTTLLTMVFLTQGAGTGRILMALWIITVFCWKVSGSHFNPCVSIAYMFRRDTSGLPRCLVLFYCMVQLFGALAGCFLMIWLQDDLPPIGPSNQLSNATGGCYSPSVESQDNNVFQAIIQEVVGSFFFVFFFMTQTEQQTLLSKEKGIVCLVIACSYVTARAMVFGQFQVNRGNGQCGATNYGAVLNPAIAVALMLVAPIQKTTTAGDAFKWIWLYPLMPFLGAALALVFYEFVFKKAREMTNQNGDASEDEDQNHIEYDGDQPQYA